MTSTSPQRPPAWAEQPPHQNLQPDPAPPRPAVVPSAPGPPSLLQAPGPWPCPPCMPQEGRRPRPRCTAAACSLTRPRRHRRQPEACSSRRSWTPSLRQVVSHTEHGFRLTDDPLLIYLWCFFTSTLPKTVHHCQSSVPVLPLLLGPKSPIRAAGLAYTLSAAWASGTPVPGGGGTVGGTAAGARHAVGPILPLVTAAVQWRAQQEAQPGWQCREWWKYGRLPTLLRDVHASRRRPLWQPRQPTLRCHALSAILTGVGDGRRFGPPPVFCAGCCGQWGWHTE